MALSRQEMKKSLASRTRHYVDFQSKTETPDGEGGFTEVWTNISEGTDIPTEIIPIKAERRAEMRSWNIIATHYLKIRSNIPVVEVGRAVFSTPSGDRYFYIKTLEDTQTRGIEQFIIAEERRL
jgi:hypothetical protein